MNVNFSSTISSQPDLSISFPFSNEAGLTQSMVQPRWTYRKPHISFRAPRRRGLIIICEYEYEYAASIREFVEQSLS